MKINAEKAEIQIMSKLKPDFDAVSHRKWS